MDGRADGLIERYSGLIPRGEAVLDLFGEEGQRALTLAGQGHAVDVLVAEERGEALGEAARWTQVKVHTDDVMAFVPPRGRYGAVIGTRAWSDLDDDEVDLLVGRIPAWLMDGGVLVLAGGEAVDEVDAVMPRLWGFEVVHRGAGEVVLRRP